MLILYYSNIVTSNLGEVNSVCPAVDTWHPHDQHHTTFALVDRQRIEPRAFRRASRCATIQPVQHTIHNWAVLHTTISVTQCMFCQN